jgi:hypothetical protein
MSPDGIRHERSSKILAVSSKIFVPSFKTSFADNSFVAIGYSSLAHMDADRITAKLGFWSFDENMPQRIPQGMIFISEIKRGTSLR